MQIRFAKERDVPGIINLLRQVGRVHHEGRPDLFRPDAQKYSPSQIMAMLDKAATPIFVAVEDDAVLGYGFCMMKDYDRDTVITSHKSLYIDDLCVEEGYNVTLNVWCCNPGAMAFYESLGLKPQKIGMETILE